MGVVGARERGKGKGRCVGRDEGGRRAGRMRRASGRDVSGHNVMHYRDEIHHRDVWNNNVMRYLEVGAQSVIRYLDVRNNYVSH